jgi:hypothetical protein
VLVGPVVPSRAHHWQSHCQHTLAIIVKLAMWFRVYSPQWLILIMLARSGSCRGAGRGWGVGWVGRWVGGGRQIKQTAPMWANPKTRFACWSVKHSLQPFFPILQKACIDGSLPVHGSLIYIAQAAA